MPNFETVLAYPDINFVDTSVDDLLSAAISAYEDEYFKDTGKSIVIEPGDDRYILLRAQALRNYSILQSINYAARQNFLKYSTGDNLANLGANSGCTKSDPSAAVSTEQFNLGKALTITVTIPAGTRVTPGNNIFFATDKEVDIPAGNTLVTAAITCLTTGTAGNGYIPGQINTLVDSIPYIDSVANTETSQGGSDTEDDTKFAEEIFTSPEGYSVAGPGGAYEYFAKHYSSSVIDARASTPSAGTVDLRILLTGGQLPETAFLNELSDYLGARDRRPMTDKLTVAAPDKIGYDINFTYYIAAADAGNVESIKAAVAAAVNDYILWQKSEIGRDIIPDELTKRIREAGAKRAVITAPVFTAVTDYTAVAVANDNPAVIYGGLE